MYVHKMSSKFRSATSAPGICPGAYGATKLLPEFVSRGHRTSSRISLGILPGVSAASPRTPLMVLPPEALPGVETPPPVR